MIKQMTIKAIHRLYSEAITKLPANINGFPRAYYSLYMDPHHLPVLPDITLHPRSRMTIDVEVQAWMTGIMPDGMLHLLVEQEHTEVPQTDHPEDEPPYMMKLNWELENWDIGPQHVEESSDEESPAVAIRSHKQPKSSAEFYRRIYKVREREAWQASYKNELKDMHKKIDITALYSDDMDWLDSNIPVSKADAIHQRKQAGKRCEDALKRLKEAA